MPAAKTTPRKAVRSAKKAAANSAVGDVLTLSEAAAYLRVSEADLIRMIESQALPGRQVGASWRFFRPALQQWLGGSSQRKGLLSHIGAAKDDPHLQELLKSIYARRGRPETEPS